MHSDLTTDAALRPIAVVQGAESETIQQLLREVAVAHRGALRLVGLVEEVCGDDGRSCGPGRLVSLSDGSAYQLFQDLGPGSTACSLDPEGVAEACQAVCADIADGCDLVVLSKFGKLEAENRAGLLPAFAAALEAGVPILTSVSPRYLEHWRRFAAPLFQVLAADPAAIEQWRRAAMLR